MGGGDGARLEEKEGFAEQLKWDAERASYCCCNKWHKEWLKTTTNYYLIVVEVKSRQMGLLGLKSRCGQDPALSGGAAEQGAGWRSSRGGGCGSTFLFLQRFERCLPASAGEGPGV